MNKEPVYITERLTKRDSDLFDYSRGLGMYTMTVNCIPQVLIANDNGGFRRHNLIDEKDADEIFARKNPLLLKSNARGIISTVRPQFNMTKSGRNTLLGKTRNDFLKRGRQISPDLDNKQLMTELVQIHLIQLGYSITFKLYKGTLLMLNKSTMGKKMTSWKLCIVVLRYQALTLYQTNPL